MTYRTILLQGHVSGGTQTNFRQPHVQFSHGTYEPSCCKVTSLVGHRWISGLMWNLPSHLVGRTCLWWDTDEFPTDPCTVLTGNLWAILLQERISGGTQMNCQHPHAQFSCETYRAILLQGCVSGRADELPTDPCTVLTWNVWVILLQGHISGGTQMNFRSHVEFTKPSCCKDMSLVGHRWIANRPMHSSHVELTEPSYCKDASLVGQINFQQAHAQVSHGTYEPSCCKNTSLVGHKWIGNTPMHSSHVELTEPSYCKDACLVGQMNFQQTNAQFSHGTYEPSCCKNASLVWHRLLANIPMHSSHMELTESSCCKNASLVWHRWSANTPMHSSHVELTEPSCC
jgi:hypothetical protein